MLDSIDESSGIACKPHVMVEFGLDPLPSVTNTRFNLDTDAPFVIFLVVKKWVFSIKP